LHLDEFSIPIPSSIGSSIGWPLLTARTGVDGEEASAREQLAAQKSDIESALRTDYTLIKAHE
jgi:hypothetical protein